MFKKIINRFNLRTFIRLFANKCGIYSSFVLTCMTFFFIWIQNKLKIVTFQNKGNLFLNTVKLQNTTAI